ncbi:MAG: hypothetical protein HJJLKODD_01755 [Phycisphaerae bacterium]|nr:hypothetical protein [Phycisphaerae bacterium]
MYHLLPKNRNNRSDRRSGWTLVELLIVIVVLAIVATLVLPSFNSPAIAELPLAVQTITSEIHALQALARSAPEGEIYALIMHYPNSPVVYRYPAHIDSALAMSGGPRLLYMNITADVYPSLHSLLLLQDEPSGACCSGEECQETSLNDCEDNGGLFHEGIPCLPGLCEGELEGEEGACCISGNCVTLNELDCAVQSGCYLGDTQAECRQNSCDACTGDGPAVCCLPDDSCNPALTREDCTAAGGEYLGENYKQCVTDICEASRGVGVCCLADESCSETETELDCVYNGGTYLGELSADFDCSCPYTGCPDPENRCLTAEIPDEMVISSSELDFYDGTPDAPNPQESHEVNCDLYPCIEGCDCPEEGVPDTEKTSYYLCGKFVNEAFVPLERSDGEWKVGLGYDGADFENVHIVSSDFYSETRALRFYPDGRPSREVNFILGVTGSDCQAEVTVYTSGYVQVEYKPADCAG